MSARARANLFNRCFRAADLWMAQRKWFGDKDTRENMHVAYRCGWHNGYRAALRMVARTGRHE